MHFNFNFTAVQILWALTFAALLVLLVVLLGRERIRRFPWFTTSIVLMALRLLASRLLFNKLPQLTFSAIFIALADAMAIVGFLVLVEIARRVFAGIHRPVWIVNAIGMLAVAGAVVAVWGPWPPWKTFTAGSMMATLGVMQLFAQKGNLLVDLLTVELGLMVVVFGRRYGSGWRSHAQQIMIGLSTASLAQLAVQGIWQLIAVKAVPHSQAEFQRILGLREKVFNANGAIYALVLVWWIVCLWIDEPGTKAAAETDVVEVQPVQTEIEP